MDVKDVLDLIRILKEGWSAAKKIDPKVWKKIRELFKKGDKSVAFIKRPVEFNVILEISRRSFIKRYAKFILPSEYNLYLVQAIHIKDLYDAGKKEEADRKRVELNHKNPVAGRLCKLFSSGVLSIVWRNIDSMIDEGLHDDMIIGKASKILDDIISNKAIIYLSQFKTKETVLQEVAQQFESKGYCLAFATESQVARLEELQRDVRDHPAFSNQRIELVSWKSGEITHACLSVTSRVLIKTE